MNLTQSVALACALKERVNALALQQSLPTVFKQSSKWHSVWQTADYSLRRRTMYVVLNFSDARLPTLVAKNADLALQPVTQLQQMLFARCLYARRDALRRCIDRDQRNWMRSRLSPCIWDWLITSAAQPSPSELLPTQDEAILHWYYDGWRRFVSDGVWSNHSFGLLVAAIVQIDPFKSDLFIKKEGYSADFLSGWRDLVAQSSEQVEAL